MDVYINDVSAFLPGDPVSNDEIENYIGTLKRAKPDTRELVLEKNGIITRYYAIDPKTKAFTHTNAQLTAEAVKRLKPYENFKVEDIECLCCGTSSPDLLVPGHGLMVHGELATPPCEVFTTSGICLSGITALKYGWMNIAMGHCSNAVATGSELASSAINSELIESESGDYDEGIEKSDGDKKKYLPFDTYFLRWMLSDAAGAVFMSNKKNKGSISLRIDWIEHDSYAGELETCMYAGGKKVDGKMVAWRSFKSQKIPRTQNYMNLKQDVGLLAKHMALVSARTLQTAIKKYNLKPDDVTWLLPHYSSELFRPIAVAEFERIGFVIPTERWFTNLTTKGNTGSASIYVILEELFHSGKIKKGDKLLCFIPESGRFSVAWMMLTAV